MHDRAGHAGLQRVVEEHRVQHGARRRVEAEADIRQAEDDLDVGEFVADQPDAFQRPLRQLAVVLVAGGDGEGQRIDQQVGLRQAVLVAGEFDQPARDAQLVLRRSSPCPASSIVSAITAAPNFFASTMRSVAWPSPSSKLIELMIGLPPCSFSAALDHRRLGAVDHQRRVHRGGEAADHLVHLARSRRGRRRRCRYPARCEPSPICSRPMATQPSQSLRLLQLAPFLRAVGVAALADGEDSVLLAQRHLPGTGWRPTGTQTGLRGTGAGRNARRAGAASRPAPGYAAIEVPQQPPIRLTPVLGDEALQPGRHVGGAERIMRVPVHQFRQAGIGLHRDQAGPVGREPADMLRHFLRAGRAVQPDQRHVQRMDDGRRGGDVGADQQRAGGLDRHLHEDRRIRAGLRARDLGAVDRRLDLQRVLAGLDQDGVDAAGDQPAALLGQRGLQRVVVDVAQARQFGARPDAADHPAVAPVGEALGRLARQFAGDAC